MFEQQSLSYLLTKKNNQKIKILKKMKGEEIKIKELESFLGLSKRKVKELSNSLIDEVNDFFVIQSMDLRILNKDGILIFMKKIEDIQYIKLLSHFQKMYLDSSPIYRAILFSLEKRAFNLLEIGEYLMYSQSHSYKILNSMKNFLYLVASNVYISKEKNQIFKIDGNESEIRLLHYHLTLLSYNPTTWHFVTIGRQEIRNIYKYMNPKYILEMSPLNKIKNDILAIICSRGLNRGKKIDFFEEDVYRLGEIILTKTDIRFYLIFVNKNYSGEKKLYVNECMYFSLLRDYLIPEIKSDAEEKFLGERISFLKKNKIAIASANLMKSIKFTYNISQDVCNKLIYIICNRIIVIYYFDMHSFIDKPSDVKLNGDTEFKLSLLIDRSFGFLTNQAAFKKLKYILIQILSGYIIREVNDSQRVYIEFLENSEYKIIIENALALTYNPSVLKITQDYFEADIIISDHLPVDESQKFYYFSNIFNQESWEKLGIFLSKNINKNIQEKF